MSILRLLSLWLAGLSCLQAADMQQAQLWTSAQETRLVLTLSGPVTPQIRTLTHPNRLVLDLPGCTLTQRDLPKPGVHPVLAALRAGKQAGATRLVLDLRQATPVKTYVLPQGEQMKLVIELKHPTPVASSNRAPRSQQAAIPPGRIVAPKRAPATHQAAAVRTTVAPVAAARGRDVVVAIDAGHGGVDPGAIGAEGIQEKEVTLAIARRLATLLNAQEGIQAVLTRDGDYFIPLHRRMQLARAKKADLFISIHADSAPGGAARGSSVYVLSQRGASSTAAKWLADRENAADLLGGVRLVDKDAIVSKVLLDLSQTGSRQASVHVADSLLAKLDHVGAIHKREVQAAGFAVLKAPDVPSVLVETAFLSHPQEAHLLASPAHQTKLATALMHGVVGYFDRAPPPGTYLAQRRNTLPPAQASADPNAVQAN